MERHNAGQNAGQAQMRRDDLVNQPSDIHHQGQASNFLQGTGTQAKNMAQEAVNLARGAAAGAANMAHGAADAVKNTLGMNAPGTATTGTNHPSSPTIDLEDPFRPIAASNPSNTNYSRNPNTRM